MTDKIRYSCNQKEWHWNMRKIIVKYFHRSEANHYYLIRMVLPKYRIDRQAWYPKCWRFK